MYKIDIKTIEEKFQIKLKRNSKALGLDTAEKTGYSYVSTDDKQVSIDVGFIDMRNLSKNKPLMFSELLKAFESLINSEWTVVIEAVFYSRNPQVTILLARIGAFAYVTALKKKCKIFDEWTAGQARCRISLNGTAKKEEVSNKIKELLGIKLTNDDELDAIVLGLNGILETPADKKFKGNK